jgi:hypothetical protein
MIKLPIAAVVILAFAGCEKLSQGSVDPTSFPPFVSTAVVHPDTVKLTSLVEQNGLLAVSVDVRLKVVTPPGTASLSSVVAQLLPSAGNAPILTLTLADNGVAPDSTGGDGVYSGTLHFSLLKSASGRYRVRFSATTTDGLSSNLLERPLYIARNNVPPILSDIQCPDTVTVPIGSSVYFKITVKAVDGDGQTDIKEVFFRSLDSSDPSHKIIMKDDGNADGFSGDAVAGDSVFSVVVTVPDGPTVRKTYRFGFGASDAFGDTSVTILKNITIR